jgi:hypothetical protein
MTCPNRNTPRTVAALISSQNHVARGMCTGHSGLTMNARLKAEPSRNESVSTALSLCVQNQLDRKTGQQASEAVGNTSKANALWLRAAARLPRPQPQRASERRRASWPDSRLPSASRGCPQFYLALFVYLFVVVHFFRFSTLLIASRALTRGKLLGVTLRSTQEMLFEPSTHLPPLWRSRFLHGVLVSEESHLGSMNRLRWDVKTNHLGFKSWRQLPAPIRRRYNKKYYRTLSKTPIKPYGHGQTPDILPGCGLSSG